MGLMNKVEYIDGKINEIKDKLDIPMSSSLQEVVDSVGKFNTQEKTVRPETSSVYVSPDEGYDGLSRVTVSPIKAAYIEDLKPDIIKNGAKVLEMTGTYGPSSQIKTVYPSTLTQKIYPDSGIEYLSMVQVQGVDYTIDSDITPENIKKGINILGMTGTYDGDVKLEALAVSPSTEVQNFTPEPGTTGFSPVRVNAVTSSIDENIKPENIRQDISILGVTGTYAPMPMQANKYITPTTNETEYYPDEGYGSFEKVTVRAISASLDPDLKSSNIRRGVDIFGVRGNMIELNGIDLEINPSIEQQTFQPTEEDDFNSYTNVVVNPVTANIDANIIPENIKANVDILGIKGTYVGSDLTLQEKIITPNDNIQDITPDEGYNALSKVTVNAVKTKDVSVDPQFTEVVVEKTGDTYLNRVTVNKVSSSVDGNIKPENIKQNISILGVVGTYTGEQQEIFGPISNGTNSIPGVLKAIQNLPDGLIFSGTNADYAFTNMAGLLAAPYIDFSNITSMRYCFSGCTSLTDISNLVNLNNVKNLNYCFNGCNKLTDISPLSNLNGPNDLSYMYKGCTLLASIPDLTINSTDEVNMSYTFNECNKLSDINKISNPSGALKLFHTFDGCATLKNINNFSLECTSASLEYTYANCSALIDISQLQNIINTNNITSLSHCFYNDENILLPQTLKLESPDASYMFGNEDFFKRNPRPSDFEPMLQGDTFIDLTNVENAQYFIRKRNFGSGKLTIKISSKTQNLSLFITHYIAEGAVSLELTSDEICSPDMNRFLQTGASSYTYIFSEVLFDEKIKPTDLSYAFQCNSYDNSSTPISSGYKSISINLDECLDLSYAFDGCPHLVEINFTGESRKCTRFYSMLDSYGSNTLQRLTTLRNIYFDSATEIKGVFGGRNIAVNLTTIENVYNIGMAFTKETQYYSSYSVDVRYQTKLTYQSIMNIINGLYDLNISYDVANGGTLYRQKLILNASQKGLLTPEEIQIATDKGWDITTS